MGLLVPVIGVLIVLVILGMIAAMIISNEKARKQRVLSVIRGRGGDTKNEDGSRRNQRDKRRAEIAKKLKEGEAEEEKSSKKKASMTQRLRQAGIPITAKQFWLFSVLLGVLLALVVKLLGWNDFVVLMAFITGLLGVPRFVLRHLTKKRQKKFLEEFPDALEAMVRLLKAGMPVSEAIAMAGREFEGPVGEEMMQIYDAQKVGIPLPEAVLEASRRMPITEMQMFATGIAIQAQTGSSLSEVLTNLARVIRARFRLKRKVQALSAEAKASAMIIGSLPFLVGLGLYFINQDYLAYLFNTTAGIIMVSLSAVWMMIGIMVMKIMINFKV